jgi:small subunit ribosomal protein S10
MPVKKQKTKLIKKKEEIVPQKIRIKLRAYDNKVLDKSANQIIETVKRFGAEISGPIPLPTEIRKYTVNRSTFVHKDAREQYEVRVYKRLIDIFGADQRAIESLTNLNLPKGVDIQLKI